MKRIDIVGQRFGRLTVAERAGKDTSGKNILWLCYCDCGGSTKATTGHLRSGHTQSCGCLAHERLLEGGKVTRFESSHELSRTRLYRIWSGMKARCGNPNAPKYRLYGGRGVKVCDEWLHDFKSFYEWAMEHGYGDGLTIDRVDCDGNYEPSNCRWATIAEQNKNRRHCKQAVV